MLIWTGWVTEQLRLFAVRKLEESTGFQIEIERLSGNLVRDLAAEGVRVIHPEPPETLFQADRVALKYDILDLLLGSKDVKCVTIESPYVNLNGDWSTRREAPTSQEGSKILDFSIQSLEVNGGIVEGVPDVGAVDSIDLHLSISSANNEIEFTIIRCSMNAGALEVKSIVSQGIYHQNTLTIKNFQLATDASRAELTGSIGPDAVHLDGEIELELKEISYVFPRPQLSGTVHSVFSVRKEREGRSANGSIFLSRGEIDGWSLESLSGTFDSDFRTVTVNIENWSIGQGDTHGWVEYDLEQTALTADMSGSGLDLSFISRQLGEYHSRISFTSTMHFASLVPSLVGNIDVELMESAIREVKVDALRAALTVSPGVLSIDTLEFRSGNALTRANGRIFSTAVDLQVTTQGIDLSQFSHIVGVKGLSGQLFADLLIQGDPRNPFIIGNFWTKQVSLPHAEVEYMNGHVSYQYRKDNPMIDLQLLITEASVFDGTLSRFNLTVNGEGSLFLYSTDFTFGLSTVELRGALHTGGGETRLVNQHLLVSSNGQAITTDGDLVLTLSPRIELEQTTLLLCGGRVQLACSYQPPDSIQLILNAEEIDMQHLAELTAMKEVLRGYLDLHLNLSGSLSQPIFTLETTIDDFNFEYIGFETIKAQANYERGTLNLTALDLRVKRGAYSIQGILPVHISLQEQGFTEDQLALNAEIHGLEPWAFHSVQEYVELKECDLVGSLRLFGTATEPKLSGTLTLRNGQFYSRFLKAFITDLQADVIFQDEQIRITSLSAKTESGHITSQGVIDLQKLTPERIDLAVRLVKLPVRGIKDVDARIASNLKVHGAMDEPSVDGTVTIEELTITTPFQQKAGPGLERTPLKIQANVAVDANRAIWVRNRNADIQLDGELNVKVKGGFLVLSGELYTVRGWVRYYDREFEIVKGRFKFTDIPEINPELDILAETEIAYTAVENDQRISKRDIIRLEITGPMRTPEIALTSESGELSELDVFSLLTLNMAWSDIGSEERMTILREQAAGRVLDLAASQLTGEIRKAVGLDAFRIRVRPVGEEAGAKLTVGKYISRDLYVSYTSELFATAKDQFRVEYFVGRRGSILTERNEEGRYFIGLNYKVRF